MIRMIAIAVALLATPAMAQTYRVTTIADIHANAAALVGKIEVTGLLAPAAPKQFMLVRDQNDNNPINVNGQKIAAAQIAAIRDKCQGGCRATVRGTLAVSYGHPGIIADSIEPPAR